MQFTAQDNATNILESIAARAVEKRLHPTRATHFRLKTTTNTPPAKEIFGGD